MDLVNTAVAIIGVLITLYVFYSQKKNRELVWDLSSVQCSIMDDPPFSPHPNTKIDILTIINGGRSSILAEEFESNLILKPLIGGSVYEYMVVPGNEKYIEAVGFNSSNNFYVKPKTLNKGDYLSIILINSYAVQGHYCMSLDGHIREIHKFESLRDRVLWKCKINALIAFSGSCTGLFISGVSYQWYIGITIASLIYWYICSVFRPGKTQDAMKDSWDSWFQTEKSKREFESDVVLRGESS